MITLSWPPTVNHYYTIARGRKILSKRGRKYKTTCYAEILSQGRQEVHKGPVSVFIRAYPPDKRKRDLDNLLKPVLDVLQTSGILEDDSQVEDLHIQRFYPSKPGRVEILVSSEHGGQGV